jgi:hypothetical protein
MKKRKKKSKIEKSKRKKTCTNLSVSPSSPLWISVPSVTKHRPPSSTLSPSPPDSSSSISPPKLLLFPVARPSVKQHIPTTASISAPRHSHMNHHHQSSSTRVIVHISTSIAVNSARKREKPRKRREAAIRRTTPWLSELLVLITIWSLH